MLYILRLYIPVVLLHSQRLAPKEPGPSLSAGVGISVVTLMTYLLQSRETHRHTNAHL